MSPSDAPGRWPARLDEAVAACAALVRAGAGLDWAQPAGRLDWSCRETVQHVASDFVGYAAQLMAPRTQGYVPFDVVLDDGPGDAPDEGPDAEGLADVVLASGRILVAAARSASPKVVSWHPYGPAGPGDFCAMGVVEALVHSHDIASGLGLA